MFEIYFLPHCSVENTSDSTAFMFRQAVNTNYIIYIKNSTVNNKRPNSIQRKSNKAQCNVVAYFQLRIQRLRLREELYTTSRQRMIISSLDDLDSQFHAPAALPLYPLYRSRLGHALAVKTSVPLSVSRMAWHKRSARSISQSDLKHSRKFSLFTINRPDLTSPCSFVTLFFQNCLWL
jgi:hypothetical protein